jgi:DNA repair protein RadC
MKNMPEKIYLCSSANVYQFLRTKLVADVEEFWVISLDSSKAVLSYRMLFRGTVDACLVHPRDVFRFACSCNASSVIISHNHPSQDPTPSWQDIRVTEQIFRAGRIIGIPLEDHVIITENAYRSFVDQKWGCFGKTRKVVAKDRNASESPRQLRLPI